MPASPIRVLPDDEHNRSLVEHTHPAAWTNPTPQGRYHLVVIGAGTAGLVTAAGAAGLGARVALVERHLMGGDCLNFGCVPSKALIRSAHAFAEIARAHEFGARVEHPVTADFELLMRRMRRIRAQIAHHDSAERFKGLGVDVYLGSAKFAGSDRVLVDGTELRFRRAVIATGARAWAPPIPGLHETGFLTNESVFSLTSRPDRLAVVGAGPIGCELAQSFARFGSKVVQLEMMPRILIRDDAEAAELITKSMRNDGVDLRLSTTLESVKAGPNGKVLEVEEDGQLESIEVDEILVAIGRAPNLGDLDLDAVGVEHTKKGVTVDDHLRTTNPKIFAAGDVASPYQFTHTADATARIVIQNTLFPFRAKASKLIIPWATYTDPELAHVGLAPEEAAKRGIETETLTQPFSGVDRALLDGDDEGFARVYVKKGGDQIVGATVVGHHAGDLIGEMSLAITNGIGLAAFGKTIHPYPTKAEVWKKLGDAYNRTRLTPSRKSLLARYLSWLR